MSYSKWYGLLEAHERLLIVALRKLEILTVIACTLQNDLSLWFLSDVKWNHSHNPLWTRVCQEIKACSLCLPILPTHLGIHVFLSKSNFLEAEGFPAGVFTVGTNLWNHCSNCSDDNFCRNSLPQATVFHSNIPSKGWGEKDFQRVTFPSAVHRRHLIPQHLSSCLLPPNITSKVLKTNLSIHLFPN